MTIPNTDSAYNNVVPNDLIIPREEEEMNRVLTDYLRLMVDNLNAKDVAIYDEVEQTQGQQWFNPTDRQSPRFGLRKVINLLKTDGSGGTGLNNFLITNPQLNAHNITVTNLTTITRIYGAATDPTAVSPTIKFIPLPFVDMTGGGNNIELCMDDTNVILRSNADYSRFTRAYIILEYVQT